MSNPTFEAITTETPFETLLSELETIAKRLEDGKLPLSDALAIYTRGIELKQACEERLNKAQLTIEQLQMSQK